MFCMGNPDRKSPTDILHLYFDDDLEQSSMPLSQEEIDELQAEMAAINAQQESSEE